MLLECFLLDRYWAANHGYVPSVEGGDWVNLVHNVTTDRHALKLAVDICREVVDLMDVDVTLFSRLCIHHVAVQVCLDCKSVLVVIWAVDALGSAPDVIIQPLLGYGD